MPEKPVNPIVTMGCGDACPTLPARHRLDRELPDPRHIPDDELRVARDRIEGLIAEPLAEAAAPSGTRAEPQP